MESTEKSLRRIVFMQYAGGVLVAILNICLLAAGIFACVSILGAEDIQGGLALKIPACIMISILCIVLISILSIASVVYFLAGYVISKRKSFRFSIALAVLESVFFPLGTSLGIISIFVLSGKNVRDSFPK